MTKAKNSASHKKKGTNKNGNVLDFSNSTPQSLALHTALGALSGAAVADTLEQMTHSHHKKPVQVWA